MEKTCRKCGATKDISEFHQDTNNNDGRKNACKKCLSTKRYTCTKVDRNIKQSLIYCLRQKCEKGFRWAKLLGYGHEEIKAQLEKQFKNDMNWDNYGEVWCCSFFIPRRAYKITSLMCEEISKLWSLKNLKVMYIKDSYKQKVKIDIEVVRENNLFDILPYGNLDSIIAGELADRSIIEKMKESK